MPVSRTRYQDLRSMYEHQVQRREDAEKLAAERLSTITRQAEEITRLRDNRPDAPVRQPRPSQGNAELRRQLDLAQRTIRALSERLDDMQASHIADTRELHDLRQGVAS